MRFGCHLPAYGPAATRETVLGFARAVERLGYDSLWVSDHVVVPWTIASRYPYNKTGDFPLPPSTDFLEPLTLLSAVAGATERVALGTSVLVLPHRHPVLTAKIAATIDRLAPGRLILGVGVGWMQEEIELFGVPYRRRGAWSDEAIRVMRACWAREERTSHAGEFFRFQDLGVFPKPARPIPIWVGGDTPAALRRVAALADGWHAAFPTAEELGPALERLRGECARAGRDFSTLTLSARVGLAARRTADELIAQLKALRDLGVHEVMLESASRDLAQMTSIFERFAHDVRPRL
ncbi:MAG: TIGR03619 family F420-dependent LLM class oxidoreductase [Candidatus Rokubacteria bacterium]|nr:TIGR03619 family F420-dependent LLM class oxidoreductase [Candidatus Rokubacteria bacterium]